MADSTAPDRPSAEFPELAPLLPHTDTRTQRYLRRLKVIVPELLLLILLTALLPVLLVLAVLVDAVLLIFKGKTPTGVRLLLIFWWFLVGNLRAYSGVVIAWIRSRGRDTPRRRQDVYDLRVMWTSHHFAAITKLLKLNVEVEGVDDVSPGPVICFSRHASIIDNTVPDAIMTKHSGISFRYVIKRELEVIGPIDIGGKWVPTSFVARASGNPEAELVQLRKLTHKLGPFEGALIYPEGTRATAKKIARAKEIIAERQPEFAELANRLQHVLPPRLGGPVALIEEGKGLDVVVLGHVGFDSFEKISNIWKGGLVGNTVRIKFWRYSASEIPDDPDAIARWVYEVWQRLDDWIGEANAELGSAVEA